ncbi:MAG TPA: deoxyribose-phosphate aldolase, partial [Atopobiaceae bacterium]|nr:deoxyribose-phosphate aldolase [Atopobiaceae bacterium]
MRSWTLDEFARLIDHTNLKPFARAADMRELCDEARTNHFAMVAVNQVQARLCAALLEGTDIHVGAAISFPLGQTTIASKIFDVRDAIANGADEIDYVVNLTEVKNGNWHYVAEEMEEIVATCHELGAISKVIFENCYLEDAEKIRLCEIASEARPDFIKTSTGFGTGGATFDDVRLMV